MFGQDKGERVLAAEIPSVTEKCRKTTFRVSKRIICERDNRKIRGILKVLLDKLVHNAVTR